MESEPERLTGKARVFCVLGALVLIPIGIVGGFVPDPPFPWVARAPLILLIVCGAGLGYLAATGKRSTFVEALVESSWFPP